jgi:hypothetical protein
LNRMPLMLETLVPGLLATDMQPRCQMCDRTHGKHRIQTLCVEQGYAVIDYTQGKFRTSIGSIEVDCTSLTILGSSLWGVIWPSCRTSVNSSYGPGRLCVDKPDSQWHYSKLRMQRIFRQLDCYWREVLEDFPSWRTTQSRTTW